MHRTALVLRSGTLEEIYPARLLQSNGCLTVWSLLPLVVYRGEDGEGAFFRDELIGP